MALGYDFFFFLKREGWCKVKGKEMEKREERRGQRRVAAWSIK